MSHTALELTTTETLIVVVFFEAIYDLIQSWIFGTMDVAGAIDAMGILIVSCKVWGFVYGLYLIGLDVVFTLVPSTLFGIVIVFGVLNHFRVPLPAPETLKEVFGEDVNVLIEEAIEKGDGREGPNGLRILPFIPTTTRLAGLNESSTNASNQNQPYTMWTVAHRGAGLDAPENSISAFRLCKSRGCNAVEFDVALTRDLVAVVIHDDTLTRVAGINRKIQEMTYAEILEADISATHPLGEKCRGERVPTLQEAINTCLGLDLRFFIDIKDCDPAMVDIILDAFERNVGMHRRAVVSSFHPTIIYHIRRRNPQIVGCVAYRPGYNRYETWNGDWKGLRFRHNLFVTDWYAILMDALLEWSLNNLTWWFVGLSAILYNKDAITKEATCRWVQKGIRVFAWTVNNPLEKLHLTQNLRIGHLTDTLDGGDLISEAAGGSETAIQIPKATKEIGTGGSEEQTSSSVTNHDNHSQQQVPLEPNQDQQRDGSRSDQPTQ